MVCSASVDGPVIHVIVPSASRPVTFSICVPSAATRIGGGPYGFSSVSEPLVENDSPRNDTGSHRSNGRRIDRYSRMCRTGLSNDSPHIDSTTIWCERPIPSASRPLVAFCVVSAWPASIIGWRGYVGMTDVPSSTSGTSRPTTASAVRASRPKICGIQ